MFPIRVISLARHARRRADFRQRNEHLASTLFDAVDGDALTPQQIEATGLFTPEVRPAYGPHAYGVALSHWHLWKEAAAGTQPVTIAEDDAVLRLDFQGQSADVISKLPADWDIVLWGWNFDSVLQILPMGSVTPVAMVFDQDQMRQSVDAFQALQTPVQAFRLEKAFGLLAYTVSARGAARLLEQCFPLRPLSVFLPVYCRFLPNMGVDIATNAVYRDLRSFACFPPLAVSPNVRGEGA